MNKKHLCYDCGGKIEIEGGEIKNGVRAVYDKSGKKISIFKCDNCFAQNKGLENFQKCEVYSRVVGYLRPIGQWHVGKQREFEERKEYRACAE